MITPYTTCLRGVCHYYRRILHMCATKPKNIQIEFSFFLDLFFYTLEHEDPDDPKYLRIRTAFQSKIDAMERHNLYSLYKSCASEEIRRKAREEYLVKLGIRDSFRWHSSQDVNVTHNLDSMISDSHAD